MGEIELQGKLIVGPFPHVGTPDTIRRIMWSVVIALIPAFIAAVAVFGWYIILVVLVSVAGAMATEVSIQRFRRIPSSLSDGSAVVTGILLAFTLPPNVPLYVPLVGSIFAIGVAKHAFGGLGCNIWNPALAGRAFLLAAYSSAMIMSEWPILRGIFSGWILGPDAVTRATPCVMLKFAPQAFFTKYSLADPFFGNVPGSIGETSALAILIGGIFLIAKRYVNWRLPLAYIATVMAMVIILPVRNGNEGAITLFHGGLFDDPLATLRFALAHALSGGLMLGAFFMATDMVTSPLTNKGQAIFGVGCGILVAIIRLYGGYPEGVCYSILIMNTAVWLIDRMTIPRFFGVKRDGAKHA